MTTPIPSTGPVSFGDLQTTFGGEDPIYFSEYNRGGLYLPSNDYTYSGASIATAANASRNLNQYRGLYPSYYTNNTYTLAWSSSDTYYGYVDIYTGGKVVIRQNIYCPHGAGWWGAKSSSGVRLWSDPSASITYGYIDYPDPYNAKYLKHDGGSLVLYTSNGGSVLASVSAPLVW